MFPLPVNCQIFGLLRFCPSAIRRSSLVRRVSSGVSYSGGRSESGLGVRRLEAGLFGLRGLWELPLVLLLVNRSLIARVAFTNAFLPLSRGDSLADSEA